MNKIPVDQEVKPIWTVGNFLKITQILGFLPPTQNREKSYKNVNVSESDAAVRDESGVEGVEVGDSLHVRDEDGDEGEEDGQDAADDGRVEPLVVPVLLLQTHVQLCK